jgi:hypothetical protein
MAPLIPSLPVAQQPRLLWEAERFGRAAARDL